MTCMAKPYKKNPCPGVMKFPNLIDPSLIIVTIYLPTSREEDFKRNISILHFFTLKQFLLKMESHLIYNFLSPYPRNATYRILPIFCREEDVNA